MRIYWLQFYCSYKFYREDTGLAEKYGFIFRGTYLHQFYGSYKLHREDTGRYK